MHVIASVLVTTASFSGSLFSPFSLSESTVLSTVPCGVLY